MDIRSFVAFISLFATCLASVSQDCHTSASSVKTGPSGYSSSSLAGYSSTTSIVYNGGGPTATIDAGIVHGTTTSLPAATASVNKFLGIPFAKSPPERFAPPEKPEAFSNPINATAFAPACIQQFVSLAFEPRSVCTLTSNRCIRWHPVS